MGTNYYIDNPAFGSLCEGCRENNRLHIGKNSSGWAFSFQAYPAMNLVSRKDWERAVLKAGLVFDEYGDSYTPREFWTIVDASRRLYDNGSEPMSMYRYLEEKGDDVSKCGQYLDEYGWDFTEREFC